MNFTKSLRSGFTLIELLVVVAIIGILASVVLSSLNTARAKGADAAIKANLANIRVQAEIMYDTNVPNSYNNVCSDPQGVITNQLQAAADALGGTVSNALNSTGTAITVVCHEAVDNNSWAVGSGLKNSTIDSWCVDSTGTARLLINDFLLANETKCQ